MIQLCTGTLDNGKSENQNFPTSCITNAVASIQGFSATYGDDDHHVKSINANLTTKISSDQHTVTVTANINMNDSSKHYATTSISYTLIVIGY